MARKVSKMEVSNPSISQQIPAKVSISPQRKDKSSRRSFGLDNIVLILVLLYMLIPLGATFVFSINDGKNFGLSSFQRIISDADFATTFPFSIELAIATTILMVILITPTAYWMQLRLPQARPTMDFLTLVPFGVPAIVMGFGLIQVYGSPNTLVSVLSLGLVPFLSNQLNVVNTPPLMICAYVIIALPFTYRPIDN